MSEVEYIHLPYQASLLSFFSAVRDLPYPALLDSNHAHFPDTQHDILVAGPLARIHTKKEGDPITWLTKPLYSLSKTDNPMTLLNELMTFICQEPWAKNAPKERPFIGGLLGYYGYESGHFVEHLPDTVEHDIALDTLNIGLYSWAVVTKHHTKTTQLILSPWCDAETAADLINRFTSACDDVLVKHSLHHTQAFALTSPFISNMSATDYAEKFAAVQAYIQSGDCYQVNLAQRFSSTYEGDTFTAYQALRHACPTPFSAYLQLSAEQSLLSHSPERFLLCDQGRVESKPIKGTVARGATPEEDKANADWLLASTKDRAENLMIVDLLRNDLGRTCLTGSINVPKLFALESYANVHHLVSTVEGRIDQAEHAIKVFHQSFPGGSITGAPKIRAMQIIDELEPHQRSAYCGSVVYFSANGQMDSSITIRTLVADRGKLHCWAGGGLVADSKWQEEYQETFTKVGKLTHTLEQDFLK
ncbi:aminodeoxychorismate synthase component I [Marinomonas sp. IMCC 4694]|uniref:aminodeoxychorismate synthase component I n=1 Tax=Marinomonas sp. IMCC 4694 TaxID=2605432 RepID=UPI0011E83815|nr:aminodeoxychorismate synthase component I [Marinomonas sp. IMCC 4694]TYL47573.1 aminodeoxychorismate synthase component I [Marinomonas sp. IMCC 4694]